MPDQSTAFVCKKTLIVPRLNVVQMVNHWRNETLHLAKISKDTTPRRRIVERSTGWPFAWKRQEGELRSIFGNVRSIFSDVLGDWTRQIPMPAKMTGQAVRRRTTLQRIIHRGIEKALRQSQLRETMSRRTNDVRGKP